MSEVRRGSANRGINFSYVSTELIALNHVNKKSIKTASFPTTNKGIYFLTFDSDLDLLVEVI